MRPMESLAEAGGRGACLGVAVAAVRRASMAPSNWKLRL